MKLPTIKALAAATPSLRGKAETLVTLLLGKLFDNSSTAASLVVYSIVVPNSAATTSVVVNEKVRVINVHFQKTVATGAGSTKTCTVKNGSNAITDAIDIALADNTIARAATLNDANTTVAKDGTLSATIATSGQDASGIVYITCVRVD